MQKSSTLNTENTSESKTLIIPDLLHLPGKTGLVLISDFTGEKIFIDQRQIHVLPFLKGNQQVMGNELVRFLKSAQSKSLTWFGIDEAMDVLVDQTLLPNNVRSFNLLCANAIAEDPESDSEDPVKYMLYLWFSPNMRWTYGWVPVQQVFTEAYRLLHFSKEELIKSELISNN